MWDCDIQNFSQFPQSIPFNSSYFDLAVVWMINKKLRRIQKGGLASPKCSHPHMLANLQMYLAALLCVSRREIWIIWDFSCLQAALRSIDNSKGSCVNVIQYVGGVNVMLIITWGHVHGWITIHNSNNNILIHIPSLY